MLNVETLAKDRIIVISPSGPLTGADFGHLSHELAQLTASSPKLTGLAICADAFPGWSDLDAAMSHLKFIQAHQHQIERIAVITDNAFLRMMPNIANPLVRPTIRTFALADKQLAFDWLRGSDEARR